MNFNIHGGRVYPKGFISDVQRQEVKKSNKPTNDFKGIFKEKIAEKSEEISFSKHASLRVKEREIDITSEDISKLNEALDKAKDKGCKESVLIYKNNGFITNIKNRTVITVCNMKDSEGVITNIDSVLFV
ncbi:TIGR02530 family flagellar biosynthesis protein [Oceanirhabdus seepicola]|uniref:Flagellar protein n=1 Tax=Oceanirhabdus seepicola TaxID=2828781 RepID=A0A9J6PCH8_9CLOT|nr:TIGR02530 family flagellar biosynthesis protein [Oceanirhabdus seepicola]MCM1992653.1 flagellar protein [Oceanirhabdus seepicola]